MRAFDGHSDILTDVTIRRLGGETDVFVRRHIEKLKKGGVAAAILVVWVDPPYTSDPTWRTLEILGAASEELEEMRDHAEPVYKTADMERIQDAGKIAVLLGMEGLSGLRGNASLLSMLYRFGVRHASLTWNEENEFATGVGSPHSERGLTPLGIEALRKMERLGMIVDVSHANERSFWDIYEHTQRPFIASHSNAYALQGVPRNLKDDQIKAVAERGGVIGMNAWPSFIHPTEPSVENLVRHIDYIAGLVGVEYIGFGFDFCDYLTGDTLESFRDGEKTAAEGLENAARIPALYDILRRKGYGEEDLERIAYKNLARVVREIL